MSLFLKNIFVEYKIIGWQFVCFTSLKISLHYFLAFIKSAYFHSLENNMHFLILWLLLRCSLNIFPHLCIHWSPLQYRKVSREKKTILTHFPMIYLWMVFLYLFCLWFIHLLNLWLDVFISFEKFSPTISSNIEYKIIGWSWNFNTSATWCEEPTHKTLMLGKTEGGRRTEWQRMPCYPPLALLPLPSSSRMIISSTGFKITFKLTGHNR